MQHIIFLMKIPNKRELQRIASNHFTGERTIRKGCYNQEYSPLGSNLEKNNMNNNKRFMHSIKRNWINENFDFNKFSITNEEFNDPSGDKKYRNLQNLLKKNTKTEESKI